MFDLKTVNNGKTVALTFDNHMFSVKKLGISTDYNAVVLQLSKTPEFDPLGGKPEVVAALRAVNKLFELEHRYSITWDDVRKFFRFATAATRRVALYIEVKSL